MPRASALTRALRRPSSMSTRATIHSRPGPTKGEQELANGGHTGVAEDKGWRSRAARAQLAVPAGSSTVVRCRTCGSILMVFVQAPGAIGVDLTGLVSLSQTGWPDPPDQ